MKRIWRGVMMVTVMMACAGTAVAQQEEFKLPPPFVLGFLKLVRARDHQADFETRGKTGQYVYSLQGVKGVYLLVEDLPEGAQAVGLSPEQLRTDAELRLRAAGVSVLTRDESFKHPGAPYLYLRVNGIAEGKLFTYDVDLHLRQSVFLEQNGGWLSGATTWEESMVGRNDATGVRQVVRDRVDSFCNAYLTANPKR